MTDLRFYLDPVCPFAWLTSRWVRTVAAQRDYDVEWRFISLRLLNAHVDYDAQFPADYEAGHTAGLRVLRLLHRVREEHGNDAVERLHAAYGRRIFEAPDSADLDAGYRGTAPLVAPLLEEVGLPADLVDALDDDARDAALRAETDEALALTGKDVGTPILHVEPDAPDGGTGFFGPVISRLPDEQQAAELWEHVVALARFGGFTELKRSLRERPQLASFGVRADEAGTVEDWHGGSRRQHR
jgi:hypothetical protein